MDKLLGQSIAASDPLLVSKIDTDCNRQSMWPIVSEAKVRLKAVWLPRILLGVATCKAELEMAERKAATEFLAGFSGLRF